MKINRIQLRKIINEQLNIHQYSKFAKKYNVPNDRLSGSGILSWVDRYANGEFDAIKFNNIQSWLQRELYESLRNSTSAMSTSPVLNSIDKTKDMTYFNYYNSGEFLRKVNSLITAPIKFVYDGFDKEFIQWSAEKTNASKRQGISSKVYYTVTLKDPNNINFNIDDFIEQFKIVMTNIAFQLVTICNNTNIDKISFKTWASLNLLLKTQDNIVIYTDDESESIVVKNRIDQLLANLNSDARLSLIKVLNSNERQTQLNRVVVGTDLKASNSGPGQSDTSMLAFVMTAALLNIPAALNNIKILLNQLQKDRNIDAFIANFNLNLGDSMKSVTKKWINFSSNEKVAAYERALKFLE